MTIFIAVDHGRCEEVLCSYLSKWLRVKIIPVTRSKGGETITLKETGEFLSTGVFKDLGSLKKFCKNNGKDCKNLSMDDITIFVLMDVDGDYLSVKSFRSKDMFKGSAFYDRIIPILSNPNLDSIFASSNLDVNDRNKPVSYRKVLDKISSADELC